MVAGDVVGSDRALDDLSRISQHVYRMDPDLEGIQPEALQGAMLKLAADLSLSVAEVREVVSEARASGLATIAVLRRYQRTRDNFSHPIFTDSERLKRQLAETGADEMLIRGPAQEILAPVRAALRLAFGHE